MNSLSTLAARDIDVLLSFTQSTPQGQTTPLDFSNNDHRRFAELMLQGAGRTRAAYPHLFRMLDSPQTSRANLAGSINNPAENELTTTAHLVDSGKTASGKATATIWTTTPGQTLISGGQIMVYDAETNRLLAQGTNTGVKSGLVMCSTNSANALPATKNLYIIYFGWVHYTETHGGGFVYRDMVTVGDTGIKVNVTDPVLKITTKKYIAIAIGRQGGPKDCDYIYSEPENLAGNPYLIAPFTGNVPLSGIIDIGRLTAANLSANIIVKNAGGSAITVLRNAQYTPDSRFMGAFSVGAAPNILNFSLPFDGKSFNNTASIVYNTSSIANEVQSYFLFKFTGIPFTNGTIAPPFYVCSEGTPDEPSINCTKIPNLYYWWHCLAKGTLITLEDGTQKPIEQINNNHRVKTAGDKSLAVRATVLGQHTSDGTAGESSVYRLTAANGKNIIASGSHMVFITADKCRAVHELKPGDSIVTEDGSSTVKSNEAIAYDDMFYGLALGNEEEQEAAGFPHNMAGYFAGGILTADQDAMRHHTIARYHDLDYMLPLIKPELHQDYKSALNDMRS
jgi:hypothetical protein